MNLLVVYCTHHTAPLAIRERLAFASAESCAQAYGLLKTLAPSLESVILSTCNRVELYFASTEPAFDWNFSRTVQFLSEFHQLPPDDFVGELREAHGPAAVRHLFEVTASLDSMVVGEPQIVNQVKEAYRVAEQHAVCGPLTHALFQNAIRVSARVRRETKLAEGRVSIASVAVGDFACSIFDRFHDKLVLIIGAGEMAEETLRYLQQVGAKTVVVVNRSAERGQRLAQTWGGTFAPWEELDLWLGQADVIVSTTGADHPWIDRERFAQARSHGSSRPVFILDLGAPRDFSPEVGNLENVFLYDIDHLQRTCEQHRQARAREVEKARAIIEEETSRFLHEFALRSQGEVISRLRLTWHEVSQQELERLFRKMTHWSDHDREAVVRTVERIVNKLLHPPLEALRDPQPCEDRHGLIHALRRLFRL
ncbi:MAG: glutamyl-tRNA reductase [Planctomycetaceae bacterium]|nr:MAG: glutamyl-tRNA reductase [Planctomycetaceae bacterium]